MAKTWLTKWRIQDAKCPRCWAKPGKPCSDQNGPRDSNHAERVEYARVIYGFRPRPPDAERPRWR
jgi:hypothetical protein